MSKVLKKSFAVIVALILALTIFATMGTDLAKKVKAAEAPTVDGIFDNAQYGQTNYTDTKTIRYHDDGDLMKGQGFQWYNAECQPIGKRDDNLAGYTVTLTGEGYVDGDITIKSDAANLYPTAAAGTYYLGVKVDTVDNERYYQFTIDKRPITVTSIKAEDKEYDGTTVATPLLGTVKFDEGDIIGEDVVDLASAKADFKDPNAGFGKTVVFNDFELDEESAVNYKISDEQEPVENKANIFRRATKLIIDDKTKVKGEDDPVFTATADRLVKGDKLNYTIVRTSGEDVGKYDIDAVKYDENNPNYKITVVKGQLTITEKNVAPTTGIESNDSAMFGAIALIALAAVLGGLFFVKKRAK